MLSAFFFFWFTGTMVLVATILVMSEYESIDTVADVALREQDQQPHVTDALEVVNDPPKPEESDKQEKPIIFVSNFRGITPDDDADHVFEESKPKKRFCPPQERLAAALFAQEQQTIWYLTMMLLLEEHHQEEQIEYNSVNVEDYDDLNDHVVAHVTKKPRGRKERGNQGLAKRARRLGIEAKRN